MSTRMKSGIAVVVMIALFVALLVLAVSSQGAVSCEVCVTFRGNQSCRTALGANREEAIRTAHDNACGGIAFGMTDSISCTKTPADSITCDDTP